MNLDDSLSSAISQIVTRESAVLALRNDASQNEKSRFLGRFQMPIFRFLRSFVTSSDEALELFQQFSIKYLSGGLSGFDPQRGSFTKYICAVLRNLVIDYKRSKNRELPSEMVEDQAALPVDYFMMDLIDSTWERLERENESKKNSHYELLRAKVDQPQLRSADLADEFGITADSVRQQLRRARDQFGKLLIDTVMEFNGSGNLDQAEQDLNELGLMEYCRPQLEERRAT